jgi:hypothetical protein
MFHPGQLNIVPPEIRAATELPLLVGSGVTPANVMQILGRTQGVIVVAGGDHRVSLEEIDIARQFLNRTIGDNGMATVLNVAIGKNANMFSAQHTAVAQRLSGFRN